MRSIIQLFTLTIFCTSLHAMDFQVSKVTNSSGHTINLVRMKGAVDNNEPRRWSHVTSLLDSQLDTLFVLNSPGGNVPLGLFTIKKIDEFLAQQAQLERKTWIVIEGQCSSLCVPLFFTWRHRFAVVDTKIGLHGVSNGGMGDDGDLTAAYLNNMRDHAREREEPAALAWLERMISLGRFSSFQLTPLIAQDVARENGLLNPNGIVRSVDELMERL